MKISAIKQQEKQKDRYSIFVDGAYGFSLHEVALLEQKLAVGQEIDRQELKSFKKLSSDDKAYSNALRFAAMRRRSEWELREYARRKQLEESLTKKILNKLSDIGLVNDETFARSWVENRRLLKPVSKRRLVQELRQKRVDEAVIKAALDEDETDEQTVLQKLIDKKRGQIKYRSDKLKLMQYLSRQGFSYEDIKTALTEDTET